MVRVANNSLVNLLQEWLAVEDAVNPRDEGANGHNDDP